MIAAPAGAQSGPYPPGAGRDGTTAIEAASALFAGWATGFTNYLVGTDCDAQWQTPDGALGPPTGIPDQDIVCLGRGGEITFTFGLPIADGPGPDFAVFENAVTDTFLEVAFVQVSSDGANFFRFSTHCLSPPPDPNTLPILRRVYPSDVDGFASKYVVGFGTPHDLEDLGPAPGLDRRRVRFVRVVDIPGDGSVVDRLGNPIYDPYPMTGSAGVDLDAVGVIQFPTEVAIVPDPAGVRIEWRAPPNRTYQLRFGTSLDDVEAWMPRGPPVIGSNQVSSIVHPPGPAGTVFYRVERTVAE